MPFWLLVAAGVMLVIPLAIALVWEARSAPSEELPSLDEDTHEILNSWTED